MQYHYVVFYDSEKKGWNFCYDSDAYFPDGNVWDDSLANATGDGWFQPELGTMDYSLDESLLSILYSIVDIFPIPGEDEEDGWKRRTRSPIGSIYADLVKDGDNA